MRQSFRFWACAAATFALTFAAGCGQQGDGENRDGPGPKDALADLGNLLKTAAEEGRKPPAKPADLAAYDATNPVVPGAIAKQEIVYTWGAGYVSGSTAVVAYETGADTKGGWVLLQDGAVKQLTADEFKAAPRARK